MSSSGSSANRKPIRQLIRELNERFAEIAKFNENLQLLREMYEDLSKRVPALEQEVGRVEECLVRLVTDHNELIKFLQPPELQRYPADLMPREVRTDPEGKVLESKMVTSFEAEVLGDQTVLRGVGAAVRGSSGGGDGAEVSGVRPGELAIVGVNAGPRPSDDPVIVAGGELLADIEAKEKEVHTLWSADTTEAGVMERRLAELEDMKKLKQPESQPESIEEDEATQDEATHGMCEFSVDWADCPHCGYGYVCDRA